MKIGFIGNGNMANAIISGIIKGGFFRQEDIATSDMDDTNQTVVDFADYIFLTIKPQIYKSVVTGLKNTNGKVFITVAPAISIASMEKWGCEKVVRTMPNTPALVGLGVTAVCRGRVSDEEYKNVKMLLSSFSSVYEIEESKMNDAVALSGSSPAYAYMFIDIIAKHSAECGIDYEIAVKMIAQTLLGAAKMVLDSDVPASELCDRVCSKGGTTIKAVEKLDELGFDDIISQAMKSCSERAKEMTFKLCDQV